MTMPLPNQEWWRGAVIYQIYPRSFADSNDDGIGDLHGVAQHLDYVASLGVDAIWLSPFFTSPMKDFGYDVADYCNVDPCFGTLKDFDELIAKAHALQLRVIIDQVYSHTSDQHAWFQESRRDRSNHKADWYVWADAREDGSPPNNWQSEFGGPAWTWDARRRQYYLHNFLSAQPDLNVHNPEVQQALLACAKFWLDRGVDGFRLDAINYVMHDPELKDNPPAAITGKPPTRSIDFQQSLHNREHADVPKFLERIRELLDQYPERYSVAEIGSVHAEPLMHLYTQGTKRLHSAYGFNFLYSHSLTPTLVKTTLEAWPDRADVGWPSWAFSNHDAPRVVSRWAGPNDHVDMAQLAMLLLISLRGGLFIYQGEELGLPQASIRFEDLRDPEAIANWPLTRGRDGARTPMPWSHTAVHAGFSTATPWLPTVSEHLPFAVDLQQNDAHSQLVLTRRLLALRKAYPALRNGSLLVHVADDSLLVMERIHLSQHVLCVFNLGQKPSQYMLPIGHQWRLLESVRGAASQLLPPLSGFIALRTT